MLTLKNQSKLAIVLLLSAFGVANVANVELIINPQSATQIVQIQNQPTDASVTKLVQVLQVDKMVDSLIAQRQARHDGVKNLQNPFPSDTKSIFSKKTNEQLHKIFEKYSQLFSGEMDMAQTREKLLFAYEQAVKKHYNQVEVDALIGFYDTPTGQQTLQKQSLVEQEFLTVAVPAMVGDTEKMQQSLPQLGKELEKIFKLGK